MTGTDWLNMFTTVMTKWEQSLYMILNIAAITHTQLEFVQG